MEKWLYSKEIKIISCICVLIICFIAFQINNFFYLTEKLYGLSLKHSMEQVNELSMYIEKQFCLELDRNTNFLQVMSNEFSKNVLLSDVDILKLKKIQKLSYANIIGISDLEGNSIDSNNSYSVFDYNKAKKSLLKKNVYFSNVIKEKNPLFIIAVPIFQDKEIIGVLWAKYFIADIFKKIELSDNIYKYFQIVDDKGYYILSSTNKFALNKKNNQDEGTIWQELSKYTLADGVTVHKIFEMVKRKEKGNFYFKNNENQGRYVNFRPLDIHNWYLFSVQVEAELYHHVETAKKIILKIFLNFSIGLFIIFGLIYSVIYNMYKKISKQHDEIQMINSMFQATLKKTGDIPFNINEDTKKVSFYGMLKKDVISYYSFNDMLPDVLLEKKIIDPISYEDYTKLYQNLIIEKKICKPVILYLEINGRKEWIRVSIISQGYGERKQLIGVLENYEEHKAKDLQIKNRIEDIKRIKKKSQIDFLTNLYNREAFHKKVQYLLKKGFLEQSIGALILIDLDYFKEVNDTMGHGTGDLVLQETAQVLHNFFREGDIVGRLGGDEFIAFVKNICDVDAFKKRIQNLNTLLCNTYNKDAVSIQVSASIGIVFTDKKEHSFYELYEKADQALYKVKQSTKNGYCFYSEKDNN